MTVTVAMAVAVGMAVASVAHSGQRPRASRPFAAAKVAAMCTANAATDIATAGVGGGQQVVSGSW